MMPPSRRASRWRAFTLLEMLVVLAIVASLAALTLPSVFRPMGKSSLVEAGRQVQAAMLEARTRAIESGTVQDFRYEPDGRRFEIQTNVETDESGMPVVPTPSASAAKSPLQSTVVESLLPSDDGNDAALEPVRDQLPDGIVFADPWEEILAAPLADSSVVKAVTEEDDVTGQRWSAPIRFYPNGRSRNAHLKLRGSNSWSISILLRGLLGTAMVGPPTREEDDQAPSAEEE